LLENLALRQQLAVLNRSILTRDCRFQTNCSGVAAAALAGMEAGVDSRPTGNGCSLASSRIQVVLDVALAHRNRAGRKCVSRELRDLIFRMVAENPTWGAPRIHGELKMLGFDISSEPCCAG